MKNVLNKILCIIFGIICVVGVSLAFINGTIFTNFITKALNLKITPSFIGGPVVKEFYDDSADDNGSGILRYPANSAFGDGSLDLLHYTVHKPVYEAKWQKYSEYWQLDLEYRNGPADVRNIMIYIDIDGDKNGCFETLSEGGENITFDENHPWDFALWICDGKAKIYNNLKELISDCQLSISDEGKKLIVRIPLQKKELQKIYTSQKTYHYVFTGAYSRFDRGGFMPIEKRKSISRGSTEKSSDFNNLIPRLYDILGDSSQLGSWSSENLTKAVMHPVEVEMDTSIYKTSNDSDENASFVSEIMAKMSDNSATSGTDLSADAGTDPSENSVFGFETLDLAEEFYQSQIKQNPDDAKALAYYASCVAMRGGQSSVLQAVNLVNKSFEYFEKAVACVTPENEFEVYMNRANVYVAVPDSVFGKTETGARDFIHCAEISKKLYPENPVLTAYLYICASKAFKSINKETDSIMAIQEAKKVMYNESKGD